MKKKLLAAAVLAALTISTATAFAGPAISGDAQIIAQKDNSSNYSDMRIRLNFDQDLGEGFYAHARLMGIDEQYPGHDVTVAGTGSSGAYVNMEQMYLGAKLGAVDVKFGRQPLFIGQGLIADVNGIEGVSLASTAGDFNMNALVGRSGSNDVVGANLGAKAGAVNLGAGYMKKDDQNYYSLNADTKIDNVTLSGEYVNNNTMDAKGFLVKATVGQAVKKGDFNYAVSYRNIEQGAVDADWTTNGALADSKGVRLEANYKVTNNANLWLYKDITTQHSDSSVHPNQMRAELDVNF